MEKTLYQERFEHDACGIGAVVNIDGQPSHGVVDDALTIAERKRRRAQKAADAALGCRRLAADEPASFVQHPAQELSRFRNRKP